MKRFGQIIGLDPEKKNRYTELHRECWPEVKRTIRECHIRNYSIYYRDGQLFSYFEYHGEDFAADMQRMGECPHTKKWWALVGPMQRPLEDRGDGEWWAAMEEVFHLD